MPLLRLKSTRNTQPAGVAKLDCNNPIAAGAVACFSATSPSVELVTRLPIASEVVAVPIDRGVTVQNASFTSTPVRLGKSALGLVPPDKPFTIYLCIFIPPNPSSDIICGDTSVENYICSLAIGFTSSLQVSVGVGQSYNSGGYSLKVGFNTLVVSQDPSGKISIFVNQNPVRTIYLNSRSTQVGLDNYPNFCLGGNGATNNDMEHSLALALITDRPTSASLAKSFNNNPLQIFSSQQRVLAFDVPVSAVSSALTWVETNDAASITAAISISGSSSWAEVDDTASISVFSTVSGISSWSETSDSVNLTGTVGNAAVGNANWVEVSDTTSIAASVTVSGSSSWGEQSDTVNLVGAIGNAASGNVSWTEANDTASMSGISTVSGITSWTETNDTSSLAGSVGNAVGGNANWTEANDTISLLATVSINASAGWAEQSDLTGFSASVLVNAGLAWSETHDIASMTVMTGQGANSAVPRYIVGLMNRNYLSKIAARNFTARRAGRTYKVRT